MPARRPPIIAHHLIWTLYGHWLPNDIRGSGSVAVRDPKFESLGNVHLGRKPAPDQPTRADLKEFYREATPLLEFRRFWIDEAKRQPIGEAFGRIVLEREYTVWVCAILSNHAHMVVRRHRDDALTMWRRLADSVRAELRGRPDVGADPPSGRRGRTKSFSPHPSRFAAALPTSSRIRAKRAAAAKLRLRPAL